MMLKKMGSILVFLSMSTAATAAQVCLNNVVVTTPSERFTAQADDSILDDSTQLIWKRCLEGEVWDSFSNTCTGVPTEYTWEQAFDRVEVANASGGFSDWRLPNIKELISTVELSCHSPALNVDIFPVTSTNLTYIWSSSIHDWTSLYAWTLSVRDGDDKALNKTSAYHVRLVRG